MREFPSSYDIKERRLEKGALPKPQRLIRFAELISQSAEEIMAAKNILRSIDDKDHRTTKKYYAVFDEMVLAAIDLENAINELGKALGSRENTD